MKKSSLEELPPVLILHLKFFVFNKDGGSQKLMKKVDFPVELEITKGRKQNLNGGGWVAKWLVLLTSDNTVLGSNPPRGRIQLLTVKTLLHRAFHYHPSIVSV